MTQKKIEFWGVNMRFHGIFQYLQYLKLQRFFVFLPKNYGWQTYLFLTLKLQRFQYFLQMVADSEVRDGPGPGGTIMVGETQRVFLSITCNVLVSVP